MKDFFPTWLQFQSCSRPVPQSSWLPYTCIDQLSLALKDMKQDSHYERVRVPLSQQFSSYKMHDASWFTHLIFCLETAYQFCCWRFLSDFNDLNLIFIKSFSSIFIKCFLRIWKWCGCIIYDCKFRYFTCSALFQLAEMLEYKLAIYFQKMRHLSEQILTK